MAIVGEPLKTPKPYFKAKKIFNVSRERFQQILNLTAEKSRRVPELTLLKFFFFNLDNVKIWKVGFFQSIWQFV